MVDITEDQVLAALREVEDPSQGKDLVALDMVSGLHIKQSNVSFALQVPAHRGPAMEPVRRAAEAAVRAIPGVTSATVMVTAHSSAATAEAPPDRTVEKVIESRVRRFIAVASGKGGVGILLKLRGQVCRPLRRLVQPPPSRCHEACQRDWRQQVIEHFHSGPR